jgi:hypothetical protein
MRFPLHKVLSLAATLSLLAPCALAQTVNLGYYDAGEEGYKSGFKNGTYSGSGNGFINTGNINGGYTGASGTGQTGDAIIVTPISDPVIHFNNYYLTNTDAANRTITSVTFRLPQYAPTDPNYRKLGFLDTRLTAFGTYGSGNSPFTVEYSDPITPDPITGNTYNGDGPLGFQGLPLYSTIHFWGGEILASQFGNFSFYAGYPASNGTTSFIMDVVPGFDMTPTSTPNTTFFNTAANPAGGIVPAAVTPELSGAALFVPALLPVALIARRRRRP